MPVNRLDVVVFSIAAVAAVAAALLAFQVFFRFQFVRTGTVVTRVDKLSGRTCVMPCLATPAPATPTPAPSPPSLEHQELRAIAQVQRNAATQRLVGGAGADGYAWSAVPAAEAVKNGSAHSADEGDAFVVCYCDPEGFGWRWEAHLTSSETYYVNDKKVLSDRYGARLRPKVVRTRAPAASTPATTLPASAGESQQGAADGIAAAAFVNEYYQLWDRGDLRAMYEMLSDRYRAEHPFTVWEAQHTGVVRITAQTTATGDPMTVAVVIESTDRAGGRTVDSEYRGTWTVVRESGGLKLDRVALNQTK